MRCNNQYVYTSIQKDTLIEFIKNIQWNTPISVTLTEKKLCEKYGKNDDIKSSLNTKHFLNRLNKKIYGNSFLRFNKRIKSFVVMEVNKDNRHHLHMILDQPNRLDYIKFKHLILNCWKVTNFGYNQNCIKEIYNEFGWLNYITKKRTKNEFLSSIDWLNTFID